MTRTIKEELLKAGFDAHPCAEWPVFWSGTDKKIIESIVDEGVIVSKEKYLNKEQVAKLMGMTATGLQLQGFFDELTNHSVLPRYGAYAESEVLAKKGEWQRTMDARKADMAKRRGKAVAESRKGKTYKKRYDNVSADEAAEIVKMFNTFAKKLNKILNK